MMGSAQDAGRDALRTSWAIGVAAIAVGLALLAGCGEPSGGEAAPSTAGNQPSRVIDEESGSYRGVRLGDTAADVQEALGSSRPLGDRDSWVPRGVKSWNHLGPVVIPTSRPTQRVKISGFRYKGVFVLLEDNRVTAIDTIESGAITVRGVAIDDPLEKAEVAYPELECGTIDDSWRACTGRIGSLYMWFGGDPIRDITIGSVPLEGL